MPLVVSHSSFRNNCSVFLLFPQTRYSFVRAAMYLGSFCTTRELLTKDSRGLFAHTNDVVGSQIKAQSVMCFFFFFFWCSIPFFLLQTEEQISAEKHYVWVYRLILGLHSECTSESCSFSSVTPVEVILLPLDHRVVKFQSLFWSAVSAA